MTVLPGKPWRARTFRSKLDGINRKIGAYLCLVCGWSGAAPAKDGKRKICPDVVRTDIDRVHLCGNPVEYFPSQRELKMACGLQLLARTGKITQLRFHPRFDLVVNGRQVATYVADASYFDVERQKQFIIDVKPPQFQTDESRLKIALFDALYAPLGLTVTLTTGG